MKCLLLRALQLALQNFHKKKHFAQKKICHFSYEILAYITNNSWIAFRNKTKLFFSEKHELLHAL